MLERTPPPWFSPEAQEPADAVVIVGAGLAGCWLAYELRRLSVDVTIIDAGAGPASGASGNPAGVVKPYVTRAPSPPADFYRDAFAHLLKRLHDADAQHSTLAEACRFHPCSVLQLTEQSYPEHSDWVLKTPEEADRLAGTRVDSHAIAFPTAGWLDPSALCKALLEQSKPAALWNTTAESLEQDSAAQLWTVGVDDGRRLSASHVVLANGTGIAAFPMTRDIPVVAARGQLSRFCLESQGGRHSRPHHGSQLDGLSTTEPPLQCVVSGKHYAIPVDGSIITGATFQRGDTQSEVRHSDDESNLQGCRALLPDVELDERPVANYCGVRTTTPDRLPVAGPAPDFVACQRAYADIRRGGSWRSLPPLPVHDGLSVMGGFGSRGITSIPWIAWWLARQLTGRSHELSDTETAHGRRMLANRFLIRRLMRAT